MLVLTRKTGETLRIGSDVRVTILSINGGQVRIGIDAPTRIPIHREEVFAAIEDANRRAAAADADDFAAWADTEDGRNPA